jgi:hypothetical protein
MPHGEAVRLGPLEQPADVVGRTAMLYVAFVEAKLDSVDQGDLAAKSRQWWNEGGRPAGLKTVGIWGTLGTQSPDVFIFETDSYDDMHTMIEYWRDVADIEVYPGADLTAAFRDQGMNIA